MLDFCRLLSSGHLGLRRFISSTLVEWSRSLIWFRPNIFWKVYLIGGRGPSIRRVSSCLSCHQPLMITNWSCDFSRGLSSDVILILAFLPHLLAGLWSPFSLTSGSDSQVSPLYVPQVQGRGACHRVSRHWSLCPQQHPLPGTSGYQMRLRASAWFAAGSASPW